MVVYLTDMNSWLANQNASIFVPFIACSLTMASKAQLITKKDTNVDPHAIERLENLERMRVKAIKHREDGMAKSKATMDVSKLVRTRLTQDEALTYKTVKEN